ncbi:MAG: hypothetical protein IT307_00520 [Chloroflexi bacterium]|nr:hypothetical protein [Chloroflexota bacterium]
MRIGTDCMVGRGPIVGGGVGTVGVAVAVGATGLLLLEWLLLTERLSLLLELLLLDFEPEP